MYLVSFQLAEKGGQSQWGQRSFKRITYPKFCLKCVRVQRSWFQEVCRCQLSSLGTLSKRMRSRRRGGQTIQIESTSIPFEWKSSCWLPRPLDRLFLLKGHFLLGGIFRAEWYFLLSFDAHSPPIGLQTKENVAPRGKFRLVENGLKVSIMWLELLSIKYFRCMTLKNTVTLADVNNPMNLLFLVKLAYLKIRLRNTKICSLCSKPLSQNTVSFWG